MSKISAFKSNNQYAFKAIVKMAGEYDKLLELEKKQTNYRI